MAGDGCRATTVRLSDGALALLRRAAVERAERHGARVSVSAVLADLVERNRDALIGPQDREATSGQ